MHCHVAFWLCQDQKFPPRPMHYEKICTIVLCIMRQSTVSSYWHERCPRSMHRRRPLLRRLLMRRRAIQQLCLQFGLLVRHCATDHELSRGWDKSILSFRCCWTAMVERGDFIPSALVNSKIDSDCVAAEIPSSPAINPTPNLMPTPPCMLPPSIGCSTSPRH